VDPAAQIDGDHPLMPTIGARRRIGVILVAVGLTGLALFGTAALTLAGAGSSAGGLGPTLLEAQRTLDDGAAAARDADRALSGSAIALGDTGAMLAELATTLRQGAGSLQVNVLGQRPFSDLSLAFDRTAERADAAARSVSAASGGVEQTRGSLVRLATDLDDLSAAVGRLRATPAGWLATDGFRVVALIALVWLAVVAGVMVWIGSVLLRTRG
jgi:hypothetical protein